MSIPFKQCTMCLKTWDHREQFLDDPAIEMIGYQPDFEALEDGLFYFNHTLKNCGTTLSFNVSEFSDMYDGPIYSERKRGTAECPGFCLYKDNLEMCPTQCSCAYVRELIQVVKERTHQKKDSVS